MSAPDIRFDCRFCNKPVNVAAKYAGQRVKCPSCKNPVVVPGERDTLAAGFTEAQTAEGGLQRVSERPIGKRRRRWLRLPPPRRARPSSIRT